ncbi:MAG: zinc ribbon domain-containing protein [Nitrosarchaeum sp.]|nr:zinc ribbon domain-containing protein [Nitrosarchaeum sp.]
MPLYEFKCKNADCSLVFEELKRYDEFDAKCPVCDSQAEKLMSKTSVVINGSSNQSVDSVIGHDAEQRWLSIEDRKNKRNQGLTAEQQNQRKSELLNRQGAAVSTINKAKVDAGITKKDEIRHALQQN